MVVNLLLRVKEDSEVCPNLADEFEFKGLVGMLLFGCGFLLRHRLGRICWLVCSFKQSNEPVKYAFDSLNIANDSLDSFLGSFQLHASIVEHVASCFDKANGCLSSEEEGEWVHILCCVTQTSTGY